MQKFRCTSCKQSVAVVVQSSREQVKCPRCGAMNDLSKLSDAKGDDSVNQEQLLTQMLDAQAQAHQRKQAQQEALEAERDANLEHDLEHRRAVAERINRLGHTVKGPRSHSRMVSTIALLVMALLGWAGINYAINYSSSGGTGGAGGDGGLGGDNSKRIEPLVDQWVRSLSTGLRHKGVQYHVYYVAVGETTSEGDLIVVQGMAHAADREISQKEAAQRTARIKETDQALDEISKDSKRQLKEGIKTIRNSYDPDRMDQITSAKPLTETDKKVESKSVELRDMGFEFDGSSQGGQDAASQRPDIERPFTLVIRKDNATAAFPSGCALEYFIWDSQVKSGNYQLLKGDGQAPIEKAVNAIFTSRKEGTNDYRDHLKTYGVSHVDDLFPNKYKPVQWHLARCDVIKQRSVRAFVQVTDADTKQTGTWILTFLRMESDGQWRVARTWCSADAN